MNPSLGGESNSSNLSARTKASTFLRGDWATWRGRAITYTLCFALLALLLVGLRYFTRDLNPTPQTLTEQKKALLERTKTLTVEAQTLTSPMRVREFALSSGMIPFSKAPKEAQSFVALPRAPQFSALPNTALKNTPPKNTLPGNTLEVEIRWR